MGKKPMSREEKDMLAIGIDASCKWPGVSLFPITLHLFLLL
jgi:hypothetical protein